MTIARRRPFLLVYLLFLTSMSSPPAATRAGQDTAPAPGGAGAPGTESSAYPWEFEREHRFLWLHKREKVGETRFVVRRVPFPGRPGETLVELRATRSYHREAVVQQATGTTRVSLTGEPQRYEEKLTVLHASTSKRSTQETTFERHGERARVTFVQNGEKDRPTVDERVLDDETFLCASQAVEHWVVFVSALPKDFADREVKLYYPEQRRVFTVELSGKGEEKIELGKRDVTARRYTVRSPMGEIDGNIWIGADGRLLQITFPQTQIRVVLAE
jgi:hypothetical protein